MQQADTAVAHTVFIYYDFHFFSHFIEFDIFFSTFLLYWTIFVLKLSQSEMNRIVELTKNFK